MSRFPLEPDEKGIKIWRKQKTRNQPQNITEDHAFRGVSIMVWAGISLDYCTDLHIFKWGSVTAVRYIFGSYCQKKQTEHIIRPVSSALFTYRCDSFQADRVHTLRAHWSICS
ncbi:transposable element Tc3 transposase [Trichonephila clavipes]|nr:transposable element Tc3 transposase [Trichonephila clavipes]